MEDNGYQGVAATAFDLANSQMPHPHAKPYYGDQRVPTPTNSAAKIVHHAEVMRAVLEGK